MNYGISDKVRITESFDENYGMVGTIIKYDPKDDSYLIEFEYNSPIFGTNAKCTSWYYGSSSFVYANKPSYANINPHATWCSHEWKEEKWFTSKIFKTCVKCGKRFEES